jgi:FkbM family methyltransferase
MILKKVFKDRGSPDSFLEHAKGIIHIGGHIGQERDQYAQHGLDVVWLEPNPALFEVLCENIREYPGQRAFCELVGRRDGEEVDFLISSNNGASSSILKPKGHLEMHPQVGFDQSLKMTTMTLPEIARKHAIDLDGYDAMLLDTQGSELMIIRGAESILDGFRWVKSEAADFESYQGCATKKEMTAYFQDHGYKLIHSERIARHKGLGNYYDITFEKI